MTANNFHQLEILIKKNSTKINNVSITFHNDFVYTIFQVLQKLGAKRVSISLD